MIRLEQLQQALAKARAAGDAEAVQELQTAVDRVVGQEALAVTDRANQTFNTPPGMVRNEEGRLEAFDPEKANRLQRQQIRVASREREAIKKRDDAAWKTKQKARGREAELDTQARLEDAFLPGGVSQGPGLSGLAAEGFRGEARALPSGIATGTQAGLANYLQTGRDRDLFDTTQPAPPPARTALQAAGDIFSVLSGLNPEERARRQVSAVAQNIAGRVVPEGTITGLRQSAGENLEETLRIRTENAERMQQLKQEFLDAGGSEFVADVAGGLGSSATSFAPLAGAAITGAITRNPAAALAAQRILATLPATQAYTSAYAEFKAEYPNAPEQEAQQYAIRMAGLEYGVEALIPAGGGGLRSTGALDVAKQLGKQSLREGGTEVLTEVGQSALQLATTPELAPESVGDFAYQAAVAGTAGSIAGGAISSVGTFGERANIQRAEALEQQRLAEAAAQDASIAEGIAAAQAAQAQQEAEAKAISDQALQAAANLPRSERVNLTVPRGPVSVLPDSGGVSFLEAGDLGTPRGESSTLLNRDAINQEPIGPSSPFVPRAEGADLTTPRGETSTLLRGTEEQVGQPRGPVSILPGQTPESALGLDTPRGEATPLTETARLESRLAEQESQISFLEQEKATIQAKETPLTRREKSRVKTINKEIGRLAIGREATMLAMREEASRPTVTQEVDLPLTRQPRTSEVATEVTPEVVAQQPTQQPTQATPTQPATTPQPTTQTPTTAPLTRAERRELGDLGYDGPEIKGFNPETGREIIRNRARKEGFQSDGIVADDGEIRLPNDLNSPEDVAAASAPRPEVVPVEQRKQTVIERDFANVTNAAEAIDILSAKIAPNSPLARVVDVLKKSPFMKGTAFQIVQPESDAASHPKLQKPNTRGILRRTSDGKNTVLVKGSGFKLNGVNSAETLLHEIVHAGSYDLVRGVKAKRITDPKAVKAVEDLEALREAMNESIQNDPSVREAIGPEAASRVDYAGKDVDEFLAVSLTSAPFQAAMKLVNKWKPLLNAIRNLWGMPRSATETLNKILDAGLSVIEQQTRLESDVRRSRAQEERETIADAKRRRGDLANEQAETPTPTRARVVNPVRQRSLEGVRGFLADMLSPSGRQSHAVQRAREEASGNSVDQQYRALQITNAANSYLNKLPTLSTRQRKDAALRRYLEGNKDAASELPKDLVQKIDKIRQDIDNNTDGIINELDRAFEGREMPERYKNLRKFLEENKGKYLTRGYQLFQDPKYAKNTWKAYEEGKKQSDQKKLENIGYQRVVGFVDAMAGKFGRLPKVLDQAKQDAKDTDFDAWEMVTRQELEGYYEAFLGNPDGVSVREMFDQLEARQKDIAKEGNDFTKQAELLARRMLGLDQGNQGDRVFSYQRRMATQDGVLRKKTKINALVRDMWGESKGGSAAMLSTLTYQGQVMGQLKALNDLAEGASALFSNIPAEGRNTQIPNNPIKYGKLAGQYTDETTSQAIVALNEVLGKSGLEAAAQRLGWFAGVQKGFNTIWNPRAYFQELVGGPVLMLANGNFTGVGTARSFEAVVGLTGTAFRKDYNEIASRMLRLGLVDPVVTGGIRRERGQLQAEDKQSNLATRSLNRAKGAAFTLREIKEGIEVGPKLTEFFRQMDFYLERSPGLVEAVAKANAKKAGDRTDADKAVLKEFERLENAVADKVNETTFYFPRAPGFSRITERYAMSSFAVYMADTYRILAGNGKHAIAEIIEGRRRGDAEMVQMGLQRGLGTVMAAIATPVVHTAAAAADIKVLGVLGVAALGMALSGDDEEDILALAAGMPFANQTQTAVVLGVDEDGSVRITDAGRWESLDPATSVLRGLVVGLHSLAREGDPSVLEDAGAAMWDQYLGGSILSDTVKKGLAAWDDRELIPSVEKKAPETMASLYETLSIIPGINPERAKTTVGITESTTPMVLRNVAGAVEAWRAGESSTDVAIALMGGFSTKYNPFDDLKGRAAQRYSDEATNARRSELDKILFRPTNVSESELASAYDKVASRERDAFDQLQKSVNAARAVNRQLNRDDEFGLREALRESGMSARVINDILDNRFMPNPIDDNFLEAKERRLVNQTRPRSERQREELPELTRERRAMLQRIREEWIDKNLD
jgi:hypothetical protein